MMSQGNELLALVLALIAVLTVMWRLNRAIIRRLGQMDRVPELEERQQRILEHLEPRNGDQRLLTDRVDGVRRSVQTLVDDFERHKVSDETNFKTIEVNAETNYQALSRQVDGVHRRIDRLYEHHGLEHREDHLPEDRS